MRLIRFQFSLLARWYLTAVKAVNNTKKASLIQPLLKPDAAIHYREVILASKIISNNISTSLVANACYFDNPAWAAGYFNACHRDQSFIERWQVATGTWQDKVVVDVGCGPGNVFASLGGSPRLLIGVDISLGALKMAERIGYHPLLADAQDLPLRSEIADIVVVNATLHHCDDMVAVLKEAARLVKPGGVLVCDHDPQKTAWDFKGVAHFLWRTRLPIYRFINRGGHATKSEQRCVLASEAHHVPGDGLSIEFYHSILDPMGFSTHIYPHNHTVGSDVFTGEAGHSPMKYRLAQWLSGINPNSPGAALSLMCVSTKAITSNHSSAIPESPQRTQ